MRRLTGLALSAAIVACALASAQERNRLRVHQLKDLKVVNLGANGHTIHAWVMDNESKRSEGLMFVTDKDMRVDQGALFVFSTEQVVSHEPGARDYSFWMRNTLIPLDIIYIDRNKKVINVGAGKPKSETPVHALRTYFYTLELKGGTAKKLGIKPGAKIEIPGRVSSID